MQTKEAKYDKDFCTCILYLGWHKEWNQHDNWYGEFQNQYPGDYQSHLQEGFGSLEFYFCHCHHQVMWQLKKIESQFVIPQAFLNGCGHGACGAHSTWIQGMLPWSTSIFFHQFSCISLALDPPSSHRRNNNSLQSLSCTAFCYQHSKDIHLAAMKTKWSFKHILHANRFKISITEYPILYYKLSQHKSVFQ